MVREDEFASPANVRLFGTDAVVAKADGRPQRVEQSERVNEQGIPIRTLKESDFRELVRFSDDG